MIKSNISRNNYTKLKEYKDVLNTEDKLLFLTGVDVRIGYLVLMNEYEMMPKKITHAMGGIFVSEQNFKNIVKNYEYDYIFIYRMRTEDKEKIKNVFEYNQVNDDTLYRVVYENDNLVIEEVNIN